MRIDNPAAVNKATSNRNRVTEAAEAVFRLVPLEAVFDLTPAAASNVLAHSGRPVASGSFLAAPVCFEPDE